MNAESGSPTATALDGTYATSSALWLAAPPFAQAEQSLVARAYETLWKQIVEGDRQPGERLVDAELVAELGVSRTPIRHALYQLQQAGLVGANPRRGFHVAIFDVADVRDLYDLRTVLEVAAIRAATGRIPEAELQAAAADIDCLRRTPEPELSPRFLTSDVQFHHVLIAGNSGNRRLSEAIAQQRARMSVFLVGGTRLPGATIMALNEHEHILHALLERDVESAAKAMEQHIQRVKADALDALASRRTPRVRRFG